MVARPSRAQAWAKRAIRTSGTMALALLLAPSGLTGQEADFEISLDRFRLYTGCARIGARINVQDERDDLAGLTAASVRTAVTSRLRSARIYSDDFVPGQSLLLVYVQVAGALYRARVELHKLVFDSLSESLQYAQTWSVVRFGTHGRSSQSVRGVVAENMDRFIDEYLRVTGAACGMK